MFGGSSPCKELLNDMYSNIGLSFRWTLPLKMTIRDFLDALIQIHVLKDQ
jgi:hypothetical protein